MKKILVTGASSYIGTYLCKSLSKTEHQVYGLYNTHPVKIENVRMINCEMTHREHLENICNSVHPDIIFHLASVTQAKTSQHKDEYVHYINHEITDRIAFICNKRRTIHLVYTSTDLVYAEGENLPEDSALLRPLTVYAESKLLGEDSVRMHAKEWTIFRLSLVYGRSNSSYKTFYDISYEALSKGEQFRAFTDQFRSAIYVEDVVENLIAMIDNPIKHQTINLCGDEYLSRFEMCEQMADVFSFDKSLIVPSSCDEFKDYKMVKNLRLNNDKMKRFGLKTKSFRENLEREKEKYSGR